MAGVNVGSFGVINPKNAILLNNLLQAMLYTWEFPEALGQHVVHLALLASGQFHLAHGSMNGKNRCHHIALIVLAREWEVALWVNVLIGERSQCGIAHHSRTTGRSRFGSITIKTLLKLTADILILRPVNKGVFGSHILHYAHLAINIVLHLKIVTV